MKTMSIGELRKTSLGKYWEGKRPQPILVEKHGKPVCVVMSYKQYKKIKFWYETKQALQEPEAGKGKTFDNVEDLIKDLNNE